MNFNLQLYGGRGGSSGGGGGVGAHLKEVNALLQGKEGSVLSHSGSWFWERSPLSEFKTYLDDLTSNYGGLEEDVYYINYKNIGWVCIDSNSDPSLLKKDMSNIKGAFIDGGFGNIAFGDTKDIYATIESGTENSSFRKNAKMLGTLQEDGTVQRMYSGATLPKEVTSSGLKYTSEYHTSVNKGKTYEYNNVTYDLSGTVTKKKR